MTPKSPESATEARPRPAIRSVEDVWCWANTWGDLREHDFPVKSYGYEAYRQAIRDFMRVGSMDADVVTDPTSLGSAGVRVPFSEPVKPDEWVYSSAARVKCESCGEWIYTRRRAEGGPSAFPPDCQVCGTPLDASEERQEPS